MQWYEQLVVTQRYAQSFIRTVVIPCITRPENWEYCWPPTWLVPYVQDLVDFYRVKPYSAEQELLRAKGH